MEKSVSEPRNSPMEIPEIDHLVYVTNDLAAGIAHIERLLGVKPVPGGRHPDFGTHNALLSLGPETYLEVLAPDPSLDPPARGRLTDVWGARAKGLFTWVAKAPDIQRTLDNAISPLGPVQPCSRKRPDGSVLAWTLSDPFVGRLGGAIPFLIDWGRSPHPAQSAPAAGSLEGLTIHHPEPKRIGRILDSLGLSVTVQLSEQPHLVARIRTPRGVAELK
ncbi:MAG: hypothetical protein ACI9W4_000036 [Rhodothermales bacterium]|jgi:hypothetical protein